MSSASDYLFYTQNSEQLPEEEKVILKRSYAARWPACIQTFRKIYRDR